MVGCSGGTVEGWAPRSQLLQSRSTGSTLDCDSYTTDCLAGDECQLKSNLAAIRLRRGHQFADGANQFSDVGVVEFHRNLLPSIVMYLAGLPGNHAPITAVTLR